MKKRNIEIKLILFGVPGICVVHGLSLNFAQDDFFITCCYAKDFAEEKGPFFNAGKTVEGHTN